MPNSSFRPVTPRVGDFGYISQPPPPPPPVSQFFNKIAFNLVCNVIVEPARFGFVSSENCVVTLNTFSGDTTNFHLLVEDLTHSTSFTVDGDGSASIVIPLTTAAQYRFTVHVFDSDRGFSVGIDAGDEECLSSFGCSTVYIPSGSPAGNLFSPPTYVDNTNTFYFYSSVLGTPLFFGFDDEQNNSGALAESANLDPAFTGQTFVHQAETLTLSPGRITITRAGTSVARGQVFVEPPT